MQNAADHTTFSSLCQRLNMLVLKQRSVVRGEAALLTQGLPSYQSTYTFRSVSLYSTLRLVETDDNEENHSDNINSRAVRESLWDKFISVKKIPATDPMLTFHQFNSVDHKVITVYSNAVFRCQWPLTEPFAKTVLMLHKPRISTFADVKGEFETYVASLECFLEHDKALVPPHVTDSIQRAYLDHLAGTVRKSVKSKNTRKEISNVDMDIDYNFEDRPVINDGLDEMYAANGVDGDDSYGDVDFKDIDSFYYLRGRIRKFKRSC